MKTIITRSALAIVLIATLLAVGITVSPAQTAKAQAAGITYNLYATDGYISMADGTQLYTYGFVGGRADEPVVYQNSVVAPPGSPKTFVPGGLVSPTSQAGLGNWPAPVPGPRAPGLETQIAGNAQFPAPLIYAATGDVVTINFKNLGVTNKNAPNDPHSIHLHGLDVNAANDGVPETSVAAVPANMAVAGAGNIVVYMFNPAYAGTYMYHCHQEADIHVQMGMYGALVVYNPDDAAYGGGAPFTWTAPTVANPTPAPNVGPGSGLGGTLFGWDYTKETILMLTEVDTRQHVSEQQGAGGAAAFNPVNYQPQYWFINGLSFPNTVHAGAVVKGGIAFSWANWILAHRGYDPLIVGSVGTPDKVLLRTINLGFETQPMHMHGFHGKIIGSDQRAWPWANTPGVTASGEGLEKNTLTIGSGETYEWLVDFSQQSLNGTYAAGTQTRYGPAPGLAPAGNVGTNPAIPDPFAPGFAYVGGPTVGPDAQTSQGTGGLPPVLPVTTGQYFPFHNHDDYKATNNGVYPGGMFTMLVTQP